MGRDAVRSGVRVASRILLPVLLAMLLAPGSAAGASDGGESPIPIAWGGHLRLRLAAGRAAEHDLFARLVGERLVDTAPEARLKLEVGPFGPDRRFRFEAHAETVLRAGSTVEAERRLEQLAPVLGLDRSLDLGPLAGPVQDERRLLDLTTTASAGGQYRWSQRIDRFRLSYRPSWGSVSLGRQALTWGNGMLFAPMDLFNPFSPTDVERDYKIGDDMVVIQRTGAGGGDLQVLGVPRRDPTTGDVEWDESSVAAKLHRFVGPLEVDVLAAHHHGEPVLGGGASGFLGGAVWRLDAVWSRDEGDDFVTAVANLDRSWTWWGRNAYGFVELYFNGLGHEQVARSLEDPAVLERLARGELFTLGRSYLAASANLAAHPLLELWLTTVGNLDDGSGLVQPRLVWSAEQDLEVTLGADLSYGGGATEFGGLELAGSGGLFPSGRPTTLSSPDRVYLWLTLYF